jgi:hypothetical protein
MANGMGPKFSCERCGKSYTWKSSIAGKRAKCACGAIMLVPQSHQIPEDDPLLTMAQPRKKPALAVAAPQMVQSVQEMTPPLEYGRGHRDGGEKELAYDKLFHPLRDIHVPVGLLVAGFLGMVFWALLAEATGLRMSVVVLMASALSTAIKTMVIAGLAFVIAERVGVSFGTFWSALLKFGGIIIFTDALLLWLEVIMKQTGAITPSGRGSILIPVVELIGATAVIAMLLNYLFDMERDETIWVAGPIAFSSMLVGFLLNLLLLGVLKAILVPAPPAPATAAAPPTTAPTAPSGTTATTPPAAAPQPAPTDKTPQDRIITLRISQQSPFVTEAREWFEHQPLRGRGQKQLFERLSEAGVSEMYVDMQGARGLTRGLSGRLYVELPLAPAGRTACFDAYKTYCSDARATLDPAEAKDQGQRYLTIELKR